MSDEKKSDFVVSDRRKFTSDGELKPDAVEERDQEPQEKEKVVEMKRPAAQEVPPAPVSEGAPEQPPAPTAQEAKEQAEAYKAQTADIDARIQKELDQRSPGRKASDFEMTFEKFVASLYMTALMQLGLVHEQGMQARPDIMAARQTIDTIALLGEKTKGNLTPVEETLFQNVLYELRMAYVEVTNALTKMPQGPIDPNAGLK
jgi:hypothetical protein